jgi:hypothetical protein
MHSIDAIGFLAILVGTVLLTFGRELSDAIFSRRPVADRMRRRDFRIVCFASGIAVTVVAVYGLASHNS